MSEFLILMLAQTLGMIAMGLFLAIGFTIGKYLVAKTCPWMITV